MRLFSSTKDYRVILIFTLVAVIITGLYMVFSAFFFCTPVRAFWNRSIPDAYCLPEAVIWPLNAGIQISTDVWLVILPMPVLFRLRLPRRQKCALIFVFALGVLYIPFTPSPWSRQELTKPVSAQPVSSASSC
jgi:hypothetical protein